MHSVDVELAEHAHKLDVELQSLCGSVFSACRGSVGPIGQGDQSDSSFFLPSRDYFALLFHLRN